MTPLDSLIAQDTMRQILQCLTPQQLIIVWLRWQGLNDSEIAELLGVRRQLVHHRMTRARRTLIRRLPELRSTIEGRTRVNIHHRPRGMSKCACVMPTNEERPCETNFN